MAYVRAFPEGTRNCYEIGVAKGERYLIRATFVYGNYDGLKKLPEFDLYYGVTLWDAVKLNGEGDSAHSCAGHCPRLSCQHWIWDAFYLGFGTETSEEHLLRDAAGLAVARLPSGRWCGDQRICVQFSQCRSCNCLFLFWEAPLR